MFIGHIQGLFVRHMAARANRKILVVALGTINNIGHAAIVARYRRPITR